MFNLVLNPLTKVLATTTFLFFVTSSLMTWGYLHTRDNFIELQTLHKQLQQDFKESEESKERNAKSCLQDDKLVHDLQTSQKSIEANTKNKLEALKKIPKKNCLNTENSNHDKETSETTNIYVDIDAPFDDAFLSVFKRKKD